MTPQFIQRGDALAERLRDSLASPATDRRSKEICPVLRKPRTSRRQC